MPNIISFLTFKTNKIWGFFCFKTNLLLFLIPTEYEWFYVSVPTYVSLYPDTYTFLPVPRYLYLSLNTQILNKQYHNFAVTLPRCYSHLAVGSAGAPLAITIGSTEAAAPEASNRSPLAHAPYDVPFTLNGR